MGQETTYFYYIFSLYVSICPMYMCKLQIQEDLSLNDHNICYIFPCLVVQNPNNNKEE